MEPISLAISVLVLLIILSIVYLVAKRLSLPAGVPEIAILVLFLIFLLYLLRNMGVGLF
jgi:Flp pilus assembly protein protease CpaA